MNPRIIIVRPSLRIVIVNTNTVPSDGNGWLFDVSDNSDHAMLTFD